MRSRSSSVPKVAIAGGGPAGAVAALVLARRGLRAVVVEAAAAAATGMGKPGETLPPAAAPLLARLGLDGPDGPMAAYGHLRSQGNRSHWGSPSAAEAPFLANPHGFGWHLDRRRFEARLAAEARAAGAEWLAGRRVERLAAGGPGGRRWRLELGGGEVVEADFVVDATGRRARLARRLGARRRRCDRLVGLFAVLAVRPGRTPIADTYTLVEAVRDGWWYSARLADGELAVCRFGDGDLLDRLLLAGDPRAWDGDLAGTEATRARLEQGGYRLGGGSPGELLALADQSQILPDGSRVLPDRPRALPAESSYLDEIVGDSWIALGDAAAAYDPLSSYGIVSAMGSGYYGARAVADLLAGRREAGDAYRAVMGRAYAAYLDLLCEHYGRERRWPDSPFWRRRHAEDFARAA